jgi:hypothetical protein
VALEASCQAPPVGLCHGPQATRQQQVSACAGSAGQGLDMCQHRTLTHVGVPPSRDLDVVRTLLGGTWGPSEGPDMPSWEFRTVFEGPGCAYRGPVFLCGGPNPMMHPGVYYLSLPRGAPRPAHVVRSGTVLRVARRRRTCSASLYCCRGYP